MTDRYEKIRRALAMGPTPGPWAAHPDIGTPVGTLKIAPPIWGTNTFNVPLIAAVYGTGVTQPANAALIAACDPDTIRELLAERDQLAAALEAAREDAERLDWLAGDALMISGRGERGKWETPALLVDSTREACAPRDFRAAIDRAREERDALAHGDEE